MFGTCDATLETTLFFIKRSRCANMVRYKQRLVMMLVGIGCCAGLVVTGFGVRDSMLDTTVMQYDRVQTYDAEVSFAAGTQEQIAEPLPILTMWKTRYFAP